MTALLHILAELTALGERATPGPWEHTPMHGRDDSWLWQQGGYIPGDPDAPDTRFGEMPTRDAALIVALRNALPTLTTAAREQAAELTSARGRAMEFEDRYRMALLRTERVKMQGALEQIAKEHDGDYTAGHAVRRREIALAATRAAAGAPAGAPGKTSEDGSPARASHGEKQTAPQTTRARDDVATPSRPADAPTEPGSPSGDDEPKCIGPFGSAFDCPVHDPRRRGTSPAAPAPDEAEVMQLLAKLSIVNIDTGDGAHDELTVSLAALLRARDAAAERKGWDKAEKMFRDEHLLYAAELLAARRPGGGA